MVHEVGGFLCVYVPHLTRNNCWISDKKRRKWAPPLFFFCARRP